MFERLFSTKTFWLAIIGWVAIAVGYFIFEDMGSEVAIGSAFAWAGVLAAQKI